MEFNINEVLNNIFQDGISELNNLFATAESKRSEYARTFAPDVAERKWADLKKYHQSCKDSVIRTRTRKLQEALAPIRDYFDVSLNEYDLVLIERVSGIAALAQTETEYSAAARLAGNGYWPLIALAEKAPEKIGRPDIEQLRFLLDQLENRMINTWTNYAGTETALDSIGQIANVSAMNMQMQIQQAIEKIDSVSPNFFTFQMYAEGELLTPGEKERIAQLAAEEFTAPACAPEMVGNSILNYLEVHPEDTSMILRSSYGPATRAYAEEYGDARRINKLNRDVHTVVVSTKKK